MKEILRFIGNGSCFNTKQGNTSAFIRDKNYLLLIDCGEDTFSKIRKHNLCSSVFYVDILITHMHSDHIGSLSSFIYYLKYCCNVVPNIYFHDTKLLTFFELLGHSKDDFNFKLIKYNENYILNNPENEITIDTEKINHLSHINSIGYIITYKNNKFIYTGDSKELFPNVFELINKYKDIFNVFCYQDTSFFETPAHMNVKEMIKVIPNDLKKYFYCIHLETLENVDCEKKLKSEGFNIPEIYEKKLIVNKKSKFLLTENVILTIPASLDSETIIELLSQVNILEYDDKLKKFKIYLEDEPSTIIDELTFEEVVANLKDNNWFLLEN